MPARDKKRMARAGAGLLCAGLFYGYVLIPMGLRMTCPFRRLTGLKCPGCGVTDLCLALLHGKVREAFAYNWGLTLALPVLAWLLARRWRGGDRRTENRVGAVLLAALLVWGVWRNLAGL